MADVEAGLNETTLITRCQTGDAEAFNHLVVIYAPRIYNLAFRMLGSQQDAEDAAQEAFLRAFQAIGKFRRGAAFSTWIHRITVNVCIDEIKRRPKRPVQLGATPNSGQEASDDFAETIVSDGGRQDPAELVVRKETQAELQKALAALPPDQRAVVIMCDIQELSYEEAAAALEISVGTVKSRLHRGRQKLKTLLLQRMEHKGAQ